VVSNAMIVYKLLLGLFTCPKLPIGESPVGFTVNGLDPFRVVDTLMLFLPVRF
jgi:hypothetical protein